MNYVRTRILSGNCWRSRFCAGLPCLRRRPLFELNKPKPKPKVIRRGECVCVLGQLAEEEERNFRSWLLTGQCFVLPAASYLTRSPGSSTFPSTRGKVLPEALFFPSTSLFPIAKSRKSPNYIPRQCRDLFSFLQCTNSAHLREV